MPQAIETTRRKFYKALDQLNTTSQSSPAQSTSVSTSTAKRPATAAAAFDEARERASKRLRHSTSTASLPQDISTAQPALKKSNDAKPREPPNFSPWSHETFLARLKTFSSVSLWHPKPEGIGEVEWAKRGWVCVDVNTVGCRGGCEKRVVVSVALAKKAATKRQEDGDAEDEDDEEDEAAFERALVERYQDVIIDGHAAHCMWRKAGCKDDIYRLQAVRPSIWQPELRRRYQSILEISDAIKDAQYKPLDSPTATEKLLKGLPTDVLGDSTQVLTSPSTKALEIALHGWRGSTESASELLHCDACFQRIGLWMYQPGYKPTRSGRDDEDQDEAIIDLTEMHRDHCPWRNPATQKASGSLKGMNASQILLRVVATCARDHRRRSEEQLSAHHGQHEQEEAVETPTEDLLVFSKEEVARQDKERETRLRKLKSLFNIKRRSTKTAPKAAAR